MVKTKEGARGRGGDSRESEQGQELKRIGRGSKEREGGREGETRG